MASGLEDVVPPTRVQLYHRTDDPAFSSGGQQPHHSTLQAKTSTAFTQTAFLVRTNSDRHEIQVFWTGPDTDVGGIASVLSGPQPQAVMTVDLRTAKSCVFKSRDWIEITDSSGVCRAIEFNKEEASFSTFYERLTTIIRLINIKCSSKPIIDKENWVPITLAASRQLPPIPKGGATKSRKPIPAQLPSSDDLLMYDECDSYRASTLADWPKKAPPPTPSKKTPKQNERQLPGADDSRLDPDYTPNSSASSTLSSGRGTLGPNTTHAEDDGDYLVPFVDRRGLYANDPPSRNAPCPPTKPKTGPKTLPKDVESTSSGSSSGSEWTCSKCTFWNSSANTQCEMCGEPRRFEAAAAGSQCRECSKARDNVRKGPSYCQACSCSRSATVSRSKSFDCIECRRLGQRGSPGCLECSTTATTKSKPPVACEECHRVGNRIPTECVQCRAAAGVKSNSADNDENKRRDRDRTQKCTKTRSIETLMARDKPTRPTIFAHRSPTPSASAAASVPSAASTVPSPASSVNVDKWRCQKCTVLNPENVFYCSACEMVRDDAWQCHVCDTVICMDIVRCQRCDVWKCRLCTYQNDERQNQCKLCQQCGQPQ